MKKIFKSRMALIFVLGLVFGLFIFFPWNPLKQRLAQSLSQALGAQIQIGRLSGATGFMAGLGRGSLFGIKGTYVSLQHPMGVTLECEKLYIAPRILPFLIGDLQVGIKCVLKDGSMVAALAKIYPFWGLMSGNIKGVDVAIDAEDFPLTPLAGISGLEGLAGKLSGEANVDGLLGSSGTIPASTQWEFTIVGLQTPGLDMALAPLPPMSFSEANLVGSMTPRSLNIEKLSLGSAANPLEANFKLTQVQLDGAFNPRSGGFSGSLRIDPEFEKQQLSKISWDSAFGKADASGKREFKRSAKGQWHTFLLFGPPD